MINYCVVIFRKDGSLDKVIGPIDNSETARFLAEGYNTTAEFVRAIAQTMSKP